MTKIPEIVAPGGSHHKAIIAAKYWAEAVYLGVPFTSLRMRQNKIKTFDELQQTIDAIHTLGSKAYLTMNIFPRNQDIKIFESVVEQVAKLWADGIIFSDPGTYRIIRKYMPDIPMHLSTQTSTLNYESVQFRYDLWIRRVVLARELHIDEIKEIKKHVPQMELEVFVHGAMCMSYSGRCLLGDYMNGRPGNKGECSHACRFKYKVRLEEERRPGKLFQLENDGGGSHIMSSKDLCVIDRLEEILPYVDAIKIEGRSKSEFYVATTVKAYKHVRDCISKHKTIDPEIKNLVNVIPHRTYRDWFLFNKLADYPEGESDWVCHPEHSEGYTLRSSEWQSLSEWQAVTSTTLDTAWPLFNRNYFGTFTDQFITHNNKKYFQITSKEVLTKGMKLNYLSPDTMWTLEIIDMLDTNKKPLDKATCNTWEIYILTDQNLSGREILYEINETNDPMQTSLINKIFLRVKQLRK